MLRANNDDIPAPRAFDLSAFAVSLGRPVRRGWLSLAVADAALVLAADRISRPGDLADIWHDLRAELRHELVAQGGVP